MLAKGRRKPSPPGVLRARRLDVVDRSGRLCASFGTGGPLGTGAHLAILGEHENSWAGLGLHDDGQAYVAVSGGEKGRGVKAAVGPGYAALDARLAAAVHLRFGLPAVLPAPVKRAIKRADRASRLGAHS